MSAIVFAFESLLFKVNQAICSLSYQSVHLLHVFGNENNHHKPFMGVRVRSIEVSANIEGQ